MFYPVQSAWWIFSTWVQTGSACLYPQQICFSILGINSEGPSVKGALGVLQSPAGARIKKRLAQGRGISLPELDDDPIGEAVQSPHGVRESGRRQCEVMPLERTRFIRLS